MGILSKIWLLWIGLLVACATSGSAVPESNETPEVVASWEEGCEDEHSLVLLCREDGEECGFFRCREVVPGDEVLLASRGGGPIYIPGSSPTLRGWRGRPIGWPRGTRPVLTFRFNRHFDPKPPPPALPPGRWPGGSNGKECRTSTNSPSSFPSTFTSAFTAKDPAAVCGTWHGNSSRMPTRMHRQRPSTATQES
jgi:Predicted lipoprotein of unknown function (DUF2380)